MLLARTQWRQAGYYLKYHRLLRGDDACHRAVKLLRCARLWNEASAAPVETAMLDVDLASALLELKNPSQGQIAEASSRLETALLVLSPTRDSSVWAQAHERLGQALRRRSDDPEQQNLYASAAHLNEALSSYADQARLDQWAGALSNLAKTHNALRGGEASALRAAVCYEQASVVHQQLGQDEEYIWCLVRLGRTLFGLQPSTWTCFSDLVPALERAVETSRSGDAATLMLALAALHSDGTSANAQGCAAAVAWIERARRLVDRGHEPQLWARIEYRAGLVYHRLAAMGGPGFLSRSVAACGNALDEPSSPRRLRADVLCLLERASREAGHDVEAAAARAEIDALGEQ
jgi:tetratricopeptide (TPR) repeat protein